jgi:hypothetical protein
VTVHIAVQGTLTLEDFDHCLCLEAQTAHREQAARQPDFPRRRLALAPLLVTAIVLSFWSLAESRQARFVLGSTISGAVVIVVCAVLLKFSRKFPVRFAWFLPRVYLPLVTYQYVTEDNIAAAVFSGIFVLLYWIPWIPLWKWQRRLSVRSTMPITVSATLDDQGAWMDDQLLGTWAQLRRPKPKVIELFVDTWGYAEDEHLFLLTFVTPGQPKTPPVEGENQLIGPGEQQAVYYLPRRWFTPEQEAEFRAFLQRQTQESAHAEPE